MTYRVDKKTLLFNDLDRTEAEEVYQLCQRLVMNGSIETEHPAFLAWNEQCEFVEPHRIMLGYSVAFPQRAMLSLLNKVFEDMSPK